MSTAQNEIDPKDPAEIVPIAFEFAKLTDAPTSPVVAIVRHSGAEDASDLATTMVQGSPQIVGSKVVQKIKGGVAGANYRISCQVDAADGCRYLLAGLLRVASA